MNNKMSSALAQGDNTQVVLVGSNGKFEAKVIDFSGDELLAVKDNSNNKVYTGIGYICKGLGFSKDQKDRQVKNIQSDIVLKRGCVKFDAGVIDQNNEVLAIDIDYLPMWLAKISITPKMKEQQPEVVEKLVEYQLKAKDVLAQVFVHKKPTSAMEELRLHYKALEEHSQEIQEVKAEVADLKDNMPLFNIECKEIQSLVKKKGTSVLGGYKSNAYNDNSLRGKVYSDIQKQLRREFGVEKYEAIKRSQFELAKQIISEYKAPLVLSKEIDLLNEQASIFDK